MIDGKTVQEILAMTRSQRSDWYKTLTPVEKEFVMVEIVAPVGRAKLRVRMTGENNPMKRPEVRAKISALAVERWKDPEHRAKIRASWTAERKAKMSGENNPMKRPEVRAKISGENSPAKRPEVRAKIRAATVEQWRDPEHRAKMNGENNPAKRPEVRAKMRAAWTAEKKAERSAAQTGENNPMKRPEVRAKISGENSPHWKDGASFDPYCPEFTFRRREHIRNLCDRTCTVCGRSTLQNVSESGWWFGRLAVDHLDENKMQGCGDWEWRLTALCASCHSRMQKQEIPHHLLLQLLLVNNKKHQTNLLFGESSARAQKIQRRKGRND